MLAGGHRDAGGVHAAAQRVEIGEHPCAKFVGHSPRAFGIGVQDADELGPFQLAIDTRVITTEITRVSIASWKGPSSSASWTPIPNARGEWPTNLAQGCSPISTL